MVWIEILCLVATNMLEMALLPLEKWEVLVATESGGNCLQFTLKIACGVTLTNFETSWSLFESSLQLPQ